MSNSDNFLLTIALITVLISAVSLGFTYYSVSSFKDGLLTGHVTYYSNATINITVAANVVINFTNNNIDFGTGSVTAGTIQALLDSGNGIVTNGSWSTTTEKLVLENIGTANVSLNIQTLKNASTFIGGTNPVYQFNITNSDANSCANITGFLLGRYYDVNNTVNAAGGMPICTNFPADNTRDTINISIRLVIPYNSLNGSLGDVMTAVATG